MGFMNAVKIYGERNSGTNYFEKLVEKNIEIQILRYFPGQRIGKLLKYEFMSGLLFELNKKKYLGWKHGKPKIREINKFESSPLTIVTITKNPYAFLLSLYKRPYHYRGEKFTDFKDFLSRSWPTILRENCGLQRFSSPIDLWNEKNKAFLSLKHRVNKKVINLRYEDVVKNPEEALLTLSKISGAPLKQNSQFQNVIDSTKGDDLVYSEYRDYYLNEKWKDKLHEEEIRMINEKLDIEVVKAFGYELILPTGV